MRTFADYKRKQGKAPDWQTRTEGFRSERLLVIWIIDIQKVVKYCQEQITTSDYTDL